MSTGLDSFSNPAEITAMYPFPGAEWVFVLIGVVLWIGWHIKQILDENAEYDEAVAYYDQTGIDRAMFHGSSALIANEAEIAEDVVRPETLDPPLKR